MDRENPLVSLIVRTKDRPKLLKKAIGSISAQTYRPLEVVLVNDGGCDLDVGELKDILFDISLNYIKMGKNMGRAHAGNVGMENAQGEYIGFLDDDDELYPEHVETLVAFLKQSDYKIAYTNTEIVYKEFSDEGKKIVDGNKFILSRDFSYDDLLVSNYIPFNSVCFPKDILKSEKGLDTDFNLYEDWDFLITLGEKYPFYHINKLTARYNQWSQELQINQADKEYMKDAHIKILEKHREKIPPEKIFNMKEHIESLEHKINNLAYQYKALKESKGEHSGSKEDNIVMAIRGRDMHISMLEHIIKEREIHISQLETEKLLLETQINDIVNTLGWQMLARFRTLREKALSKDTKRRVIYDLAVKSLIVLKHEGIKTFFQKAKHYIRKNHDNRPVNLWTDGISTSALRHFPSERKYNVLFLKGDWAGLTNHYRVDNMVEYLALQNIRAEVLDIFDLPSNIPYAYTFDLVIIHRLPMNPLLAQFIKTCKELDIIVIFDLDDYLFEPSIIHLIEWVKHTHSSERTQLIEHIKKCRETFEACDYFICPTDFLAKKAEETGKKAYVIRNGFNQELVRISLEVLERKNSLKKDDIIRIGYFSGTNTHQKDFNAAAPAILRILNEYHNAHLCIVGLLDLDYRFHRLSHKIEQAPFVPLEQLPHHIARVDINIVPLEADNIFCEAKSELKYFYSGILKIPTVATPTGAFQFAIRHGENGFLASTDEEWYVCLKTLINNDARRKLLGESAFSHVMNEYTPEVLAGTLASIYKNIIDQERGKDNIPESSISVSFIVADGAENYLSYAHLLKIAELLSKNGHFVRVYFFKSTHHTNSFFSPGIHIINGIVHILSSDILACTDPHNSAFIAYQNRERTSHLVYFKMDADHGDILFQWAHLFKTIPHSLNHNKIAHEIEQVIGEKIPI